MGVLTLNPTAVSHNRGAMAVTGGDELTVLQDASDATYVNLTATYPTTQWGASYILLFSGKKIPDGARVTKVYHVVRGRKSTTSARRMRIRVLEVTQWKYKVSSMNLGTDYQHATSYGLSTNAATITGTPISKRPDGSAITNTTVGRLGMEIYQFFNTSVQILNAAINVEYDEQPTVDFIDQDGDTQSIASPMISWDYQDDNKPQYAYQVQLYSGTTLTYDSGKVYTGDQFHQVQRHLPDGTYIIKVRAAQQWSGPGGEFWSNWRTGSMVIKSQVPAPPSVNATSDAVNGRVAVDILSNLNKLSFESAHIDLRSGPAIIKANLVNCTVDDEPTDTHSGNYALRATLTAANPSVPIERGYQRATPGVIYRASAYVKAAAASANLTAQVSIRFYTMAHHLISTSTGSGIVESTGAWVEAFVAATAPATTFYVDLVVSWTGGTAAAVHLADDFEIRVTNANFADPNRVGGVSRGGMFEPEVPNMFTYEDSSGELTPVSWVDAFPSSTDVSVSADVAWHGEAAILTASNGGGTTGITTDIMYPVVPGETYWLRGFFTSAASVRAFHIDCDMYDQDQINLGLQQNPSATVNSVVGQWTEISGLITIPAGAAFMHVSFHNLATVDGELHYWDGMQMANVIYHDFTWGAGETVQDPGFVIGYDTSSGPYTTIEYSEDSGATWSELVTIDAAAESRTYYDIQTVQSVTRRYRAYNWKIVEGQTLLSSKSPETADVSVALTSTWMHTEDDPTGSVYGFIYWSGGRTDVPDMGAALNEYVGREYPMASYGEVKNRTLSTGVGLPTVQDQAAFAKLATSKSRIMYRDRKGRRVWGIISNVSIVDRSVGEQVATFDLIYSGNQP